MIGPGALATAGVMFGWAGLGAALLRARLQRPAAASAAPTTQVRDLASWGGLALQGVGFALAWGVRRPAAGTWLFGIAPAGQWLIASVVAVLALASAVFAALAVRELGKQWSLTARLLQNHELVTSGPFARVRHPIYTALLGLLLATGVALSTPTATAAGGLIYLLGTHWRASREDKLLQAMFRDAYLAYARRVPRLIPRPTSRRA